MGALRCWSVQVLLYILYYIVMVGKPAVLVVSYCLFLPNFKMATSIFQWQSWWYAAIWDCLGMSQHRWSNQMGLALYHEKAKRILSLSLCYIISYLVGGLEHVFLFSMINGNNHPNWLSYFFRGVGQSRTRYIIYMQFIFSLIYGMSSFPLTNSYFSRWLLHHQPV